MVSSGPENHISMSCQHILKSQKSLGMVINYLTHPVKILKLLILLSEDKDVMR